MQQERTCILLQCTNSYVFDGTITQIKNSHCHEDLKSHLKCVKFCERKAGFYLASSFDCIVNIFCLCFGNIQDFGTSTRVFCSKHFPRFCVHKLAINQELQQILVQIRISSKLQSFKQQSKSNSWPQSGRPVAIWHCQRIENASMPVKIYVRIMLTPEYISLGSSSIDCRLARTSILCWKSTLQCYRYELKYSFWGWDDMG